MASDFVSSFLEFIESTAIPYTREEMLFRFPENGFTILLNPLEETPGGFFDSHPNGDFLYLYEDRWFYDGESVKKRILARLGRFKSLFARKCRVVAVDGESCREAKSGNVVEEISDAQIKGFIGRYHSYGYAKSKYRYALLYGGEIVAAAAFSASRPMPRIIAQGENQALADSVIFDSFEWVRYVSLPDVRVVGGMGRLLNAFLDDINHKRGGGEAKGYNPVEVMSYSDEEWSSGDVYVKLGFSEVSCRASVEYYIDNQTYERLSLRKLLLRIQDEEPSVVDKNLNVLDRERFKLIVESKYKSIKNRGSRKFLLRPA